MRLKCLHLEEIAVFHHPFNNENVIVKTKKTLLYITLPSKCNEKMMKSVITRACKLLYLLKFSRNVQLRWDLFKNSDAPRRLILIDNRTRIFPFFPSRVCVWTMALLHKNGGRLPAISSKYRIGYVVIDILRSSKRQWMSL